MYTFKANKLLLISAPSILVCRSAVIVSAPLSFPTCRDLLKFGSVSGHTPILGNFSYWYQILSGLVAIATV